MRWKEPPLHKEPNPFPKFHPIIGQIITSRGIEIQQGIHSFLDPLLYRPSPPVEIPGMLQALERLEVAIRKQHAICVWGDFDVDGQTATSILVETLRNLGGNVIHHIPNREKDGHGINAGKLMGIIDNGIDLILTCDTGISGVSEVNIAREHRVDVIITDHHDLPETLPGANAVVNPKFLAPGHPLASLSGAGVAYKLAEGLFQLVKSPHNPESLLDLVALGLVADLALMRGDTRQLVQKGLEVLRTSQRPGLQAMITNASLVQSNLTEEHISFFLAPRMNALGRLSDASSSVELLLSSDKTRTQFLADQLETLNVQRLLLCSQVTRAALARIQDEPSLLEQPIVIISGPEWPAGVIGIVASRLVEKYHKPVIIFSLSKDNFARGSARSTEMLNISAAIASQKDLLLNFGGHPMAAGLSLIATNLPEFSRRINPVAAKMIGLHETGEAVLPLDVKLELQDITPDLVVAVEKLSPYGPGFENPVFFCPNLEVQDSIQFGKNRDHRKFTVKDQAGNSQEVIWWNSSDYNQPEGRIDLAYSIRASNWQGRDQLQLELIDYHDSEEQKITVSLSAWQLIDHRNNPNPQNLLAGMIHEPEVLVWVEGSEKDNLGGVDRSGLRPANTLVIWTAPPGREEIQSALWLVKPEKIILICSQPIEETSSEFLVHLAGLVKSAIRHKDGVIMIEELASIMAHRKLTIEMGVKWLAFRGFIRIVQQDAEIILVNDEKSDANRVLMAAMEEQLKLMLSETKAFRSLMKKADAGNLFSGI